MTFAYGHQDDDPPAEWRKAFERGAGPGTGSNVRIVLLDPSGKILDTFDAMPGRDSGGPWQETMPDYYAERIRQARKKLGLKEDKKAAPHALNLPTAEGNDSAVRVFVRLDDPGMPAYNRPVVEIATPPADEWAKLAWPSAASPVAAGTLLAVFRNVYPPGVMERQNKKTMVHYKVAAADGTLTLEPAGSDKKSRYALLRGKVKLTDEGPDGFSFEGDFAAVLEYRPDAAVPHALHGTFEAPYPRRAGKNGSTRNMPLTAVFETTVSAGK